MRGWLIRSVEVGGTAGLDCRVHGATVVEVGPGLGRAGGEEEWDGAGGALIPGLVDHHVHLLAMAAADVSIDLAAEASPLPAIRRAAALPGASWVRVVGWDEGRHGWLDRRALDRASEGVPIAVQHRSGALWVLSSAALALLVSTGQAVPPGVERDAAGSLTGRVWREDRWLRARPGLIPPSPGPAARRLAAAGVTSLVDATPELDPGSVELLAAAVRAGEIPQRLRLLGAAALPADAPGLDLGPWKVVVGDHDLPDPDRLGQEVGRWHRQGRGVALHCVSRAGLALALAALSAAGVHPGDRIEHCAIADPAALRVIGGLGVAVVTQPSMVALRGDDYLARHPASDLPDLWRLRSLVEAGIPVALSSDAPHGHHDPWLSIRAAGDRRTPSGAVLGAPEAIDPTLALELFQRRPEAIGRSRAGVAPGAEADLVLLDAPLAAVLAEPDRGRVVATWVGGGLVHPR